MCLFSPLHLFIWLFTYISMGSDILYFGLSSHMTSPLTLRQLWSLRALSVGFVVPLTDPITLGLCLCFSSSSLPQWAPSNSPCLFLPQGFQPFLRGECCQSPELGTGYDPRWGLLLLLLGSLSSRNQEICACTLACVWVYVCAHIHTEISPGSEEPISHGF